jgi:hypothetical protein
MSENDEPIVLELAPLARETVGPFLLLGLEKDAGADQIEAHWAKRIIWARKRQIRIALEDINWAREVCNDPKRRAAADVVALNADTAERALRRLARRYGGPEAGGGLWQPLEDDAVLAYHLPLPEAPPAGVDQQSIPRPEVPFQLPVAPGLLQALVQFDADPWTVDLPAELTRIVIP